MRKHHLFLKYILVFFIIYAFLYGTYLFFSMSLPDKTIYLQLRRFIPCALVVTLSIYFWRRAALPLLKLWPHTLVSASWILVYPVTYWLTYHQNTSFIDNHFDIAFAAYLFAATVCLRLLLASQCHNQVQQISDTLLLGLLHTLLILVPLTQILYYFYYQSPVTESACMALLQTNPNEAREFLLQNLGLTGLASLCLGLLILLILFIRWHWLPLSLATFSGKLLATVLVIMLATGIYAYKIFHETGAVWALHNAWNYFTTAQKFNEYHTNIIKDLTVNPTQPKFTKPGTIIMVIGESASRDFISAYNYHTHDTTPWLRSMQAQKNSFLFLRTYSSRQQTVPALEKALTERNQYNNKEFNKSVTILDIAKKAGYTTYWFSNQGTIGDTDTPITIVAKTADHSAWIEDNLTNTAAQKYVQKYDSELLPYLQKVDPAKNNFVVLHIKGSHDNYINRYPPDFTRWGSPNISDPLLDYDNSIAYTDYVLEQIYT
jgi:heptose-I-phosphate ethanolaminephosphotransferase